MSIARGVRKAAKAAKKQSRGLTGNRNSQGDFMPEDIQTRGVQDAVAPDIQKYIDDVKFQIDELDAQLDKIDNLRSTEGYRSLAVKDTPDNKMLWEEMEALKAQKETLLTDLVDKLGENGIPVPPEVQSMIDSVGVRDFDPVEDFARSSQPGDEAREAWTEMGGDRL